MAALKSRVSRPASAEGSVAALLPWLRPEYRRDRKRLVRDWSLLALLAVLVIAFPIRTNLTREAAIVLTALAWGTGLALFRKSVSAWVITLACAGFLLWASLVPALPYDHEDLRGEYVRCLRAYDGAKYVWGGENGLGIDCSGLVRQGMVMATLRRGIMKSNAGLVRESAFLWWHDCSAERLGEGYGGRTHFLCAAPSLKELDYSRLRPGDIAVTESGVHTLAYLGGDVWIEADPSPEAGERVVQVSASHTRSAWFDVPMKILRWRCLASPNFAGAAPAGRRGAVD
jgi:hypothetical protein